MCVKRFEWISGAVLTRVGDGLVDALYVFFLFFWYFERERIAIYRNFFR